MACRMETKRWWSVDRGLQRLSGVGAISLHTPRLMPSHTISINATAVALAMMLAIRIDE
jgi:hypothetical protein